MVISRGGVCVILGLSSVLCASGVQAGYKAGSVASSGKVGGPMNGVYGGFNAGYSRGNFWGTSTLKIPSRPEAKGVVVAKDRMETIDIRYNSYPIGGFVGFGRHYNSFYISSEFGFNFFLGNRTVEEPVKSGEELEKSSYLLKRSYDVSLSVLPGVRVGRGLFYARLGATYTNAKLTITSTLSSDDSGADKVYKDGVRSTGSLFGGVFGVGYAYQIYDGVSLRAQYDYTRYFSGLNGDVKDNDSYSDVSKYKHSVHNASLGIAYAF